MNHKKEKRKYRNTKPLSVTRQFKPGFLEQLDKRTQIYMELKGCYDELVNDCGGEENLSLIQRTLCERFSFVKNILGQIEQEMTLATLAGHPVDKDTLAKWVIGNNSLQGIANKLGLVRKAKSVVSLERYVSEQKKKTKKQKRKTA